MHQRLLCFEKLICNIEIFCNSWQRYKILMNNLIIVIVLIYMTAMSHSL